MPVPRSFVSVVCVLSSGLLLTACAIRRPPASSEDDSGSATGADSTSEGSASGSGSEGSSESSSEEVSGSEEEGSTGFVPDDDSSDSPDDCEPGLDACGEGEKCVWYAEPPNQSVRRHNAKCIPVIGEGAPFDPCTLPNGIGPEILDDCGPESYCLDVYGTADHGFCAPYGSINVNGTCEDYPGSSLAVENGSEFPSACLHFECLPLSEDSCPPDMRCTFYPAYLYGSMFCWRVPEEQTLPLGAVCDYGQCGEGKLCARAEWLPACEGERCCTSFCDLGEPSCAVEGSACEFFPVVNYQQDPGFDALGACLLPGTFAP